MALVRTKIDRFKTGFNQIGVTMILEHEIRKIFSNIGQDQETSIEIGGVSFSVKVFDGGAKIFLTMTVYFGGNYIPKSVRNCVAQRAPFDTVDIPTTLEIDEDNYRVYLNYIGRIDRVAGQQKFVDLLEEFCWLGEKWREYLDEHDKNDLVHITVK